MTTIACTLTDRERERSRGRWHALAAVALVGGSTTARGLKLEFAAGPGVRAELDDLTALERECCAFATWTLSEAGGRLVLDVAGRTDDAVPAVQQLFRSLR
jgi:hypothetical protein